MKNKFLLLLFFIIISNVYSQNEEQIIKINLDKKTITPSKLPFDKSFKLEIASKNYSLYNFVSIYDVKVRNGKKYLANSYKKNVDKINAFHNIKITPIGKNKFEANVPYLLPNTSYEIVFRKKLSFNELKSFFKMSDKINDSTSLSELENFYKDNIMSIEDRHSNLYTGGIDEKVPVGFISEKSNFIFYKDSIKPKLDSFINSAVNSLDLNYSPIGLSKLQIVGKSVHNHKLDISIQSLLFDLIDPNNIKHILRGTKILGESKVSTKEKDYIKRKNNIDSTFKLINKLDQQLIKLISIEEDSTTYIFKERYFNPLKKAVVHNSNVFKTLFENIYEFLNPYYSFAEFISASSVNSDMKTNNGQIIIPDFGLINILAFENDGTTKYIPRPYAGINFHFGGGIDRNKRIRNIPEKSRKRFWLRSSIGLGVTIGKIDESGFSDFYNGFSPAVGYNYRIDDQIRLGTGILLLREKVKNPILDKNKIEPTLYLNITFDFNLFSTLGKAASKLIGL